jgi:hypothetical protein
MGEGKGNQLKQYTLTPKDYAGIQKFIECNVILDAYYEAHPRADSSKRSQGQRSNAYKWWKKVKAALSAEEALLVEGGLTIVDIMEQLKGALYADMVHYDSDGVPHESPDWRIRLMAVDRLARLHGLRLDGRGESLATGGTTNIIQVALLRGSENGSNGRKSGDDAVLVRDTKADVRPEAGRPGAVLRRGKRGG